MSSMSKCSFQSFMASCCSSTFNLSLFFHFISLFIVIFWNAFFHYLSPFSLFPLTSSSFILSSQQQFIHCFPTSLLGTITRDWFTCFTDAIVYFLSIAEHFVAIISPELSVLLLNKFFTPIFNANVWLHVTHTGLLIFMGVLAAVTS